MADETKVEEEQLPEPETKDEDIPICSFCGTERKAGRSWGRVELLRAFSMAPSEAGAENRRVLLSFSVSEYNDDPNAESRPDLLICEDCNCRISSGFAIACAYSMGLRVGKEFVYKQIVKNEK